MDEYIRREDVLKGKKTGTFANGICLVAEPCVTVKYIESIEPADVVQVVHARWENYSPITIKCSRCGHVIQDWRYSECKYCPNCGAKMDGGHRIEYPDIGDEIMTQEGRAVIYSVRNGYVFYFNYNKTYNATGVDKAKNVIKTGRKFPDYKKSLERMRAEQE